VLEGADEGGYALGNVNGHREESVSQSLIDVELALAQSPYRPLEEIEAGELIAISG
jgi:hypothetical protein